MNLPDHGSGIRAIAHAVRRLALDSTVRTRLAARATEYVRHASAHVCDKNKAEHRQELALRAAKDDPVLSNPSAAPGPGFVWFARPYRTESGAIETASAWVKNEPLGERPETAHALLHAYALLVAAHDLYCTTGGRHGAAAPIMPTDFSEEYATTRPESKWAAAAWADVRYWIEEWHDRGEVWAVLDASLEAVKIDLAGGAASLDGPTAAADRAFGAARDFVDHLATLAHLARQPRPAGQRPDAWKDAALAFAMAFTAWDDLTQLLTPAVCAAARRVYPAGAPAIKLGKARPQPTVIEAVARELGVYFRNTMYQGRSHPLEPDRERIAARSMAGPKGGADYEEMLKEETRELIRERSGIRSRGDAWDLFADEWTKQGSQHGEATLSMLRFESIDFDELRMQLIREAEAVLAAASRPDPAPVPGLRPTSPAPGTVPDPVGSPPASEGQSGDDTRRDAAWIRKATDGGLDPDTLRKMVKRGALTDVTDSGGRRLYNVEEVARKRPSYAQLLRDALAENADFRKPRKAERLGRTKPDKSGQKRTKPDI